LPALHALFLDSIGGVFRPHGFEPPAPPFEVFAGQQRHVLATGVAVVSELKDGIAGFASAWSRGDDWFLASLFVAPSAQGRGLGKVLTLAGLHHLAGLGVGEVLLYVESDNAPAVAVYSRLGFEHAAADTHVQYARTP
jgi:ribosomal protein S18 acetylase RimI-like enzyme